MPFAKSFWKKRNTSGSKSLFLRPLHVSFAVQRLFVRFHQSTFAQAMVSPTKQHDIAGIGRTTLRPALLLSFDDLMLAEHVKMTHFNYDPVWDPSDEHTGRNQSNQTLSLFGCLGLQPH